MNHIRRSWWLVAVSIAVLMALLVASWTELAKMRQQIQATDHALMNDSINQVDQSLQAAISIFHGGVLVTAKGADLSDASIFVAQSAGVLNAIQRAAQTEGVHHLGGIGERLQMAAFHLAHPTQNGGQFKADENFITDTQRNLRGSVDTNWHVNAQKLNQAILQIYRAMSPYDRAHLFPSGETPVS